MSSFYEIIANNNDFIVVNKFSGISTIKESNNDFCLKSLIEDKISEKLYIVHRLDKETSGLVVFAKSQESHRIFNSLFEQRAIYKEYITIVYGDFPCNRNIEYPIEETGSRMKVSDNGKYALTGVEVLERYNQFTLLKIILYTGRKHQIRVHLSFLGYPIIGDTLYGYKKPIFLSEIKKKYKKKEEEKPLISRTALHSSRIEFEYKDKKYSFFSPLPKDMKAVLYQLRKNLIGVII